MEEQSPKKSDPSPDSRTPSTPVVAQAFVGFLTTEATLALIIWLVKVFPTSNDLPGGGYWTCGGVVLPLVMLIAVGGFTSIRWRWTGFYPGMVIGMALSCLIGVGICFAAFSRV